MKNLSRVVFQKGNGISKPEKMESQQRVWQEREERRKGYEFLKESGNYCGRRIEHIDKFKDC